jgi:Type VI secretion system VasI, EvfG, VC_A0118
MTPENAAASEDPEAPAPAPPKGPGAAHILAVAAAVAGGGLLTLLVMTSRPAARGEAPVTAPAAALSPSRPAPTPSSTIGPTWSSKHQSRWISNHRKSAAFELDAIQPVAVWMKQVRPTLVVRCMDNRTDVFVYTESAARIEEQDENHTVRVAFDGDEGTHERWPDSVEHDALFAPDGKAMARRILASKQMRFTFSPHNAAPVTATFDVAGLQERLAPVAKRCGR